MTRNPFKIGGPVEPERFVDRDKEVGWIFDRLLKGDSIAVSGEPRIGKSSLLQFILDPKVREKWLGDEWQRLAFVAVDCHEVPDSSTPEQFWGKVLRQAEEEFCDGNIRQQINGFLERGVKLSDLSDFFRVIGRQGGQLVVQIDEFDVLVSHANFRKNSFWGTLRSSTYLPGGLRVVTYSRSDLATLDHELMGESRGGSPLLYHLVPIALKPFARVHVDQMVDQALTETSVSFAAEEKNLIWQMSGGHPYLAQYMAWCLFDTRDRARPNEAALKEARSHFLGLTDHFFRVLFYSLSGEAKTSLLILILEEIRGGHGVDPLISHPEFKGWIGYHTELNKLARAGLVQKDTSWRLTSGGLGEWLVGEFIVEADRPFDWRTWFNKYFQHRTNDPAFEKFFQGTSQGLMPEKLYDTDPQPVVNSAPSLFELQFNAIERIIKIMTDRFAQTFNFHAPVTGNVTGQVQGSVIFDAGQVESMNNLLSLIAQRIDTIPNDLPAEQRTAIEGRVKELQGELAKPSPDSSVISGGVKFLREVLVKAVSSGIADHWKDILEKLKDVVI